MRKIGEVKIYDNWSGIIISGNKDYKFRKDDIVSGTVKIGDEVIFTPEQYPYDNKKDFKLTARFIEKKELSR